MVHLFCVFERLRDFERADFFAVMLYDQAMTWRSPIISFDVPQKFLEWIKWSDGSAL
jgi:hypothetical protein